MCMQKENSIPEKFFFTFHIYWDRAQDVTVHVTRTQRVKWKLIFI